jgi:hypothetical protein
MRRAHSEMPLPPDLVPRTAKVPNTSSLTETPTVGSWEPMDRSLAAPDLKKRKRKLDNGLGSQNTSGDGNEEVSV